MARTRPQEPRIDDAVRGEPPPEGTEATAAVEDGTRVGPVDPTTLVDTPREAGDLAGPGDGAGLPTTAEPEPTAGLTVDGPAGDYVIEGPAGRGVHDPGDVVGEGADAGLSSQLDGLDDLLAGEGGYGGADGRNDASDGGGPGDPDADAPDFGAGSPVHSGGWHGLEGANGKLGDWQQDYLNKLNDQMKAAAEAGDHEEADRIYENVVDFLDSQRETPDAAPADGGTPDGGAADSPYEAATSFGAGAHGDTKQVYNKDTGEFEEVPADTPTSGSVPAGSETKQMQQTGTDSQGNQETPTPAGEGAASDREWEGEAPDLHGDFIEEYHRQQTGADGSGDIDPDPNADPTTGVMDGDAGDHDPYVAEYEPGTEVTADQVDAAAARIDPVPDEEFLEA